MNAEIQEAIHKFADEAAALFRKRLLAGLNLIGAGRRTLKTAPIPTIAGVFDWRGPGVLARRGHTKANGVPIQLCPVPGCKNRAAPVYGMVCKEHRKVPKAKIKKYRLERKAARKAK